MSDNNKTNEIVEKQQIEVKQPVIKKKEEKKCKGNCVSELKESLEGIKEAILLIAEKKEEDTTSEEASSSAAEVPIQQQNYHGRGNYQQYRGGGGRGNYRGRRGVRFYEPYFKQQDRYRRAGSHY
uniref:Uncharacterized protein n=2 Tax=Meloidogyne TaxID=189290 RepID=A0A6V7Y744_MELEN|nr:unnamed protein product [Meloidogyne enterolobii]